MTKPQEHQEELSPSPFAEALPKLRAPFPKEVIGKLKKGNTELDYVGHAAVTDRLLTIDPGWNWEPLGLTPEGLPALRIGSKVAALWIRLTVAGKSVIGVGTCELGKGEVEKELIGDALRNAAMRMGVALDLWSKDEIESSLGEGIRAQSKGEVRGPQPTPPRREAPAAPQRAPAPAASQGGSWQAVVDSVDVSQPQPYERNQDGDATLWGVTVPAKVAEGFQNWGKYPVTDSLDSPRLTPAQAARIKAMWDKETDTGRKNPLLHYTWAEMAQGSTGGQRETALRFLVGKAMEKAAGGGRLFQDDHRALVVLDEMLQQRDWTQTDAQVEGDSGEAPF